MADIKTSKEAMSEYAVSWDQLVQSTWLASYPTALANEFKKLNVESILDCAGGTGYPSIQLKQMGWDISYSDGSNEMVSFFKKRLEEESLEIPAYGLRWEDLSDNLPNTYDALMCTGNSFINIASFEDNTHSIQKDSVKLRMQLAVAEFYKMLNEGGVLYIDLIKKEAVAPDQPYSFEDFHGDFRMVSTISYDATRDVRTALATTISLVDGTETDVIYKCAPLYSEELLNLLMEAGFSRIEKIEIEGADYVDGFFAFKDSKNQVK
jgi:SAM-dependent methyltransferase